MVVVLARVVAVARAVVVGIDRGASVVTDLSVAVGSAAFLVRVAAVVSAESLPPPQAARPMVARRVIARTRFVMRED